MAHLQIVIKLKFFKIELKNFEKSVSEEEHQTEKGKFSQVRKRSSDQQYILLMT